MAVYEIYSQPEVRRYKSHVCSKATFVQLFCILLTFIPPLLIAYRSEGFWQRTNYYTEQPEVHFKHQVLVVLQLSNGKHVAWSTFQNFNRLQAGNVKIPIIKSREEDQNSDGKNDRLLFTMEMPLLDSNDVIAVQLLLLFDYQLHKFSRFHMESLAYITYNSAFPGAALWTSGDLQLYQREPLSHRGIDSRNDPIIDSGSVYADTYELTSIFEKYDERNVTTRFVANYPVWVQNRGARKPFIIKATIRYPEETVQYNTGFWQLIKWAWMQYVAILVVFLLMVFRIKDFIFQNQLVPTIIERPFKEHPH